MEQQYFHGAIPSPEDKRDYQFTDLVAGVPSAETPSSYLNPIVSDIQVVNQGTSETCVACSLSYLRWIVEKTQSNNDKPFSPTYIYGNRDSIQYQGEGMILREALQTLQKSGVCHYEDLPGFYNVKTSMQQYYANKETLDPKAHPYRISSYYAVRGNANIKDAVYRLGGVMASFPAFTCLYAPNSEGKINYNPNQNYIMNGYHAVTIVGWTADNYWIVLNSWGDTWGKGGFGYIPFSYPMVEAWGVIDQIMEAQFEMARFTDIEGHWAEQAIDKAADRGVVNGFEDGSFHPDEAITRAQLCTILDRLGLLN